MSLSLVVVLQSLLFSYRLAAESFISASGIYLILNSVTDRMGHCEVFIFFETTYSKFSVQ